MIADAETDKLLGVHCVGAEAGHIIHEAVVAMAYGAFGEKSFYGKKIQGTIRSTVVIGPDGIVKKHWPTVKKAEEHPAEVLAWLRSNR